MKVSRAFGVEQEHFAFHGDGTPPSPDEINQLWRQLLESGFQVRAQDGEGNIVSIEKLTESGPIVATNDSCTHILEVAFPQRF